MNNLESYRFDYMSFNKRYTVSFRGKLTDQEISEVISDFFNFNNLYYDEFDLKMLGINCADYTYSVKEYTEEEVIGIIHDVHYHAPYLLERENINVDHYYAFFYGMTYDDDGYYDFSAFIKEAGGSCKIFSCYCYLDDYDDEEDTRYWVHIYECKSKGFRHPIFEINEKYETNGVFALKNQFYKTLINIDCIIDELKKTSNIKEIIKTLLALSDQEK